MWQITRCFFSAVLLLAAGLSAARADTLPVFSNLGSPAQYDTGNGWTVDGGVDAGQMIAVAFTPANSTLFADAQLPLGILFSNLTNSPLDVYLALSANGLPGAELAGLSVAPGQDVGTWPPGNLVTYGCTVCPSLNTGTQYWLVVDIPNLNLDYFESQAAWDWNQTLDYSSGTNFAFNDTQFGAGWQYGPSSELRPAFQIDGTAVPEPRFIGLMAACLALLPLYRLLRKGKI